MLGARNIAAHFVVENLEQIGQAMRGVLSSAENDLVGGYILAASQACVEPAPQAALEVGLAQVSSHEVAPHEVRPAQIG